MAAIMLTGEQDKYTFSVISKGSELPPVAGFYILVNSTDKYGIRDREFMAIGYAKNLSQEKEDIIRKANKYTHIYLMPDFEREPSVVLQDIEVAGFLNKEDEARPSA